MVILRPDQHVYVLGSNGTGKSTFVKRVLLKAIAKQPKTYVVILDTKDEYADISKSLITVNSPAELNEVLYKGSKPKSKYVRMVPYDETAKEYAEELLRAAWSPYPRYRSTVGKYKPTFAVRFLMDDMASWYEETGGKNEPMLRQWNILGRAPQRTGIWCCQSTAIAPKVALREAGLWIMFRLSPYDIGGSGPIRRMFGNKITNAVISLPNYGYAVISPQIDGYVEVYNPLKGKFPPLPSGVEL